MSTNATIGIMHGDKCKSIYLHSDGYLSYAGRVLLNHYNSTKAQFLVAQGDCSMLGKDIGEKIDFSDRLEYDENNIAKQCRFYKRDRDEAGTEFQVYQSMDELLSDPPAPGYIYIMRDGVWYVSLHGGPLQVLTAELIAEEE